MKRLTNYKTKPKNHQKSAQKKIKIIKNKLQIDLSINIKKYNTKFAHILAFNTFIIKKYNLSIKNTKNTITSLTLLKPSKKLFHHINLQKITIDYEIFDCNYILDCKSLFELNLINTEIQNYSGFIFKNIIKLSLINICIDFNKLEFILTNTFLNVKHLSLINITTGCKNDKTSENIAFYDKIITLLQKLSLKSLKIESDYLKDIYIPILSKINCLSFTNLQLKRKLTLNRSFTLDNTLIIQNCLQFIPKYYPTIFRSFILEPITDYSNNMDMIISKQLELLKISCDALNKSIESVSLTEFVGGDDVLFRFLDQFYEIKILILANTRVSEKTLALVVKKFRCSLRVLDIENVEISCGFLSMLKKMLVRCDLIYACKQKVRCN